MSGAEQRNERMLEEILRQPGNDTCADCHSPSPRWASVNLGIFLCVGCASVHRKLGTHHSRVKSVTLDSWSRDQISTMRSIGNTASNAIYNPNERLHPPPSSYGHEERDSEIERYIRKKYEQCAFKGGASARLDGRVEPTSLNRARERDGRLQAGAAGWTVGKENRRNPELNDIVMPRKKERDLPPIPVSPSASSPTGRAPPRARPVRSPSAQNVASMRPAPAPPSEANLVDLSSASTSTLPLQLNVSPSPQPQQPQYIPIQPTGFSTSPSFTPQFASPNGMMSNYLSPQPSPSQTFNNMHYSPQPQQGYGHHLSPQPSYSTLQQPQMSPGYQSQQAFGNGMMGGQQMGQMQLGQGQFGVGMGMGQQGMMNGSLNGQGQMGGYGQMNGLGQMGQVGQMGQMGQMGMNGMGYQQGYHTM
ncbi:hypothetical protein L202_01055 [Cryptococcus amylolentus CBS 6039]|uniref:Arf-GAP domain-containing protein n=1 Tax=Cryptococcus amylolentus CBS 6039 TaxID=1295533 RepID=A0A1E3I2N7_9TREE|nr:hypothetical protein L202_01055 [Cryptococcus amylolentus CBS 6039]ODN82778.1 hypothetical protein L202_01055 [Cryptococcus amylolentus CBS 6039]